MLFFQSAVGLPKPFPKTRNPAFICMIDYIRDVANVER
jgi:hypothetical protein